ncbi:uncharacterized protein LACBIDRAFT_309642 [Laccaria bicolor S238N-H82]|uniref:Predicted protein n=1 Tax=Laccaria bicolor (strain S238N-H82 / ATCC MYA-4686) TaxID=486041 RepID=B0DSR0_LACBS|nr:uncharacterized protein LACBIDRAFT_309642 [Laccaria bicolor S238N-H82]EDR02363.1 predicted protein [Laccaria bicolor S238N-H82]|eukprot:XP_001887040.1 predicted protein [Laccaria bicolor S238N-H82]
MPLVTPVALVEEFKKSGEFDRLRRELLTQFQSDDSFPAFKSKIEDMARHWLFSEEMMQYLPQDSVHKELAQEIDRCSPMKPSPQTSILQFRKFFVKIKEKALPSQMMPWVSNLTESICRRQATILNTLPQASPQNLTTQQLLIILNFTPLLVPRSVTAAMSIEPNPSCEHTGLTSKATLDAFICNQPTMSPNPFQYPTVGWQGSREIDALR